LLQENQEQSGSEIVVDDTTDVVDVVDDTTDVVDVVDDTTDVVDDTTDSVKVDTSTHKINDDCSSNITGTFLYCNLLLLLLPILCVFMQAFSY